MIKYCTALLVLGFSIGAKAIPLPADTTFLAENSFVGTVTNITLDGWGPGGIEVGSQLECEFLLYEDYGVPSFLADFTFFGPSDDFSFQIEGGDFSYWGLLNLIVDESLNVYWNNNFDSDGLEDTFNMGYGSDAGFFNVTFLDYATAAMTGFGTFGWEGITVDFELAAPAPVSEPSTLLLFGISLLVASRFRRKHH